MPVAHRTKSDGKRERADRLGEARREHAQAVGQALVERSGGEPRAGLDVAQRHNHNIRPRAGVLLRAHARVRRLDDRAVPGSFARARNSFHN